MSRDPVQATERTMAALGQIPNYQAMVSSPEYALVNSHADLGRLMRRYGIDATTLAAAMQSAYPGQDIGDHLAVMRAAFRVVFGEEEKQA